ncbi:cytochrome c [Tundrisphaera lichenicola]|uniref:cytochrome c n=1 Tax=Tundrisphaera lichenicola TaxID=2029860 RepID=UPI003EBE9270
MLRKFAVLTVTLGLIGSLAFASDFDDDESPTGKIMEKVSSKHNAIRKSIRTATEFKKSGSTISKNADEIVKLAKEARAIKDSAEKEKKPIAEWEKLMDDMIKSAEELSKVAAKEDVALADVKDAFTPYNKTCAACHAVFKSDE